MNRRDRVKEIIDSKPFVSLKELEQRFPEVSSMTLRRDIELFEKQGDAVKVRGGVQSMKFINATTDDSYLSRTDINTNTKIRLSERALKFIETNRFIFIDSGTTMMQLTMLIPNERLTIITADPNIALALIKKDKINVYLVGGRVNRYNMSVSGVQAIEFLKKFNIDIAFLVPSGFSTQNGFTIGNFSQCELKKFIMANAHRKIMVMDNTKLNKSLPYTFGDVDDVDIIITDSSLPYETKHKAVASRVNIITID